MVWLLLLLVVVSIGRRIASAEATTYADASLWFFTGWIQCGHRTFFQPLTEKIWIVEVVRLKVIGTDTRTLVQVLGAIFVVLFPQLGTVAELDPLLAHLRISRKSKVRSSVGLVQQLPVATAHHQTVTSGHLPHLVVVVSRTNCTNYASD